MRGANGVSSERSQDCVLSVCGARQYQEQVSAERGLRRDGDSNAQNMTDVNGNKGGDTGIGRFRYPPGDSMPDGLSRERPVVRIAPADMVDRQFAEWPGLRADLAKARQRVPLDCEFNSHHHLLIAAEHSERADGETVVEGLPKSTLQSLSGKLTFVPAGHRYWGWQQPRVLARVDYFYIDPEGPLLAHAFDVRTRRISSAPVLLRPRALAAHPQDQVGGHAGRTAAALRRGAGRVARP